MQKKKYTDLSVPELKKLQKVFLGIFVGLVIVWIILLATLIPNFINILNISNQIKQKEKEL